jgi:hypothetical protein
MSYFDYYFMPRARGQRWKIPYLGSKIWNRYHHKNKASNNVV